MNEKPNPGKRDLLECFLFGRDFVHKVTAKEKAFKQISFARDFVDEVSVMAEASDRSPAKQIEHCVRIAQAVEQILPSRAIQGLKAGELPAADLLAGLAAVLANPGQSTALRGIMDANPIRISQAPGEPDVFIRTNADGSKDRGTLDDNGGFVPARNVRVPEQSAANQLLATALEKCQPTPDDPRPVLLFIAGPNGSGKSSIFELVRQAVGPHIFVNADLLAKVLPNIP
eukprot:gene58635-80298_t